MKNNEASEQAEVVVLKKAEKERDLALREKEVLVMLHDQKAADLKGVLSRLARAERVVEAAQNHLDGNNCHPDNDCSSECAEFAREELVEALAAHEAQTGEGGGP